MLTLGKNLSRLPNLGLFCRVCGLLEPHKGLVIAWDMQRLWKRPLEVRWAPRDTARQAAATSWSLLLYRACMAGVTAVGAVA